MTGTMIQITHADVMRVARAVIGEFGYKHKYVSPNSCGCLYVHTSDGVRIPGCLIAQILTRLGVPLEELREGSAGGLFYQLRTNGVAAIEPDAGKLMQVMQQLQDKQMSWGDAFNMALDFERTFNANK